MDYTKDSKGYRFSDSHNSSVYTQIIVSPKYKAIFAKRSSDNMWDCINMEGEDFHYIESEHEPLYLDDCNYAVVQNNKMVIKKI